MTIWPPDPEDLKRPAYRSLAEAAIRAIEEGALKEGDRMPTHRQLAYELGLSVQTVSRAYEELIRRGVIAGEVGRGTFVRSVQTEVRTPFISERQYDRLIDFSILKPVAGDLQLQVLRKALADMAKDLPAADALSFRPTTMHKLYRDAAVAWLARCGVHPDPEAILLTNGNTSAMTVALMTAANPGDLIVSEELGHHTLKLLTRYLGLRIEGLTVDEQGVVPDDFARICESQAVKALFLMPSGLNPLAAMMGQERREALCEIAREHNVYIIENDAWGPLQPDRPAPLATLAPERTFYFTSFTKCIMPGLRAGYLSVPDPLASAARNRHLVTNWVATPLLAEIASRWVEDGTAEHLLDWQMSVMGARNDVAARIMADIPFNASPNGLHIWLPLPEPWNEDAFVSHARLQGVAVAPGSSFAISDVQRHPGLRVCLGDPTDEALERGLHIVARLVRSKPEPALLAI